jgi:hypothetical protein
VDRLPYKRPFVSMNKKKGRGLRAPSARIG